MKLATAIIVSIFFASACAGSSSPVRTPPARGEPTAPAAPEPSSTGEAPEVAVASFEQVPAPPGTCADYSSRAVEARSDCPQGSAALEALDRALAMEDALGRDTQLAAIEGCPAFESGLLRAIRAERAPDGCADVLIAPFVTANAGTLRRDMKDALSGLAIGARLSRLVREPPTLPAPYDKARFMAFFEERLSPWIAGQAKAIHGLSLQGARLSGYGKAVAAVEAGLADMRFVDVARSIPLPEEMAGDKGVSEAYFAALDEALEPRKARGRDAALVGLRQFEELGVITDARVTRARELLSRLFGGRRIDALDGLLLPELPAAAPASVEERLQSVLSPFHSGYLLPAFEPRSTFAFRTLVEKGIPPRMRARLASSVLPPESAKLFGRALFRLGQVYWRAEDFVAAARVLEPLGSGKRGDEEAAFVGALASVLAAGPKDAAEMMLRGPRYPAGIGKVEALDRVARGPGTYAAFSEFDAAYIMRLVPPTEPDPAFWEDVAVRFHRAEKRVTDPALRKMANENARAAEDTAKALRAGGKTL